MTTLENAKMPSLKDKIELRDVKVEVKSSKENFVQTIKRITKSVKSKKNGK